MDKKSCFAAIQRGLSAFVFCHACLILWMMCVICLMTVPVTAHQFLDGTKVKKILILNSYHKGYKWSDDIVKGIEDKLQGNPFDIRIEYMDTKRIEAPGYIGQLAQMYSYKFANDKFNLIISSDDTAYQFIEKHHHTIFKDTPVVACGLNYFHPESQSVHPWLAAVVPEVFDIEGTLNAALEIHPETTTVYVINDHTPTGRLIQKAFDKIYPRFLHRLEFISLDGEDIDEISKVLATAPETSLGLLLVYFKDSKGNYYEPWKAARMITEKAVIPVYGVWDFYMNHGIMGGVLTQGYGQGSVAATAALEVLSRSFLPENKIRHESANAMMFDYTQLKRFHISLSAIPRKATVVNMKYEDQKNILILNSYSRQLKWTHDIVQGMVSVLDKIKGKRKIFIEDMDTKNFPDSENYSHLLGIYKYKYAYTDFDVVLVSDDNAFEFALNHRKYLFKDTPIVFCGVNYLNENEIKAHKDVTGILETTDIRGTLNLMYRLHPDTRNILVINDQSATGIGNKKRVIQEIPASMAPTVHFEFTPLLKMTELQHQVETLPENTLILLMTFNRDQNNNVFSYSESIDLIASHTKNPIYGVWDFYLGKGIVGGMLTSGWHQGRGAAQMVLKILSGTSPDTLLITRTSDAIPMFDTDLMTQHGISKSLLPYTSSFVNDIPPSQKRYQIMIRAGVWILGMFVLFLIYLLWRMRSQKHIRKTLELQASIDHLTGLFNRSAGMEALSGMIKRCDLVKMKMVLCYVDVNKLKPVNDNLGHTEGDRYIKVVARTIKNCVRARDVVARVGGDEFLLALYNHDLDSAKNIVQRIRKTLDHKGNSDDYPYDVGASFGMSLYNPTSPCTMETLIDRADDAMYKNKIKN